jgi:hypothetical protein
MTSLKINTIDADSTTTFSQVPSISATVTAYPSLGTTIPTTTWTNNTITSRLSSYATTASLASYATIASLSSYALLSSANFTLLSRGSKRVITTTTAQNVYCQFGNGSATTGGTTISFGTTFGTLLGIVCQIKGAGAATNTMKTSGESTTGFTATSGSASPNFDYIAWGY